MELYIDNINVFADTPDELKPNVLLKATVDTYNPSAVKANTSKTISIPDTVNANIVFALKRDKYDFRLVDEKKNKIYFQGYCMLDSISNKGKKEYNVTLYSTLADFFYNLKGDENNPKKISDLYWRFINEGTGQPYTKGQEKELDLFTYDSFFTYNNWKSDLEFSANGKHINTTFKPVPCDCENSIDKNKVLINNNVELFPLKWSGRLYLPYQFCRGQIFAYRNIR